MKRSTGQFERRKNDLYRTWDPRAVAALLPHLPAAPDKAWFAEPCAGNGVLLDQLVAAGHICVWASDIEPGRDDIHENDAAQCGLGKAEMYITNPPWSRPDLHEIIVNLSNQAPTWLLFDADWAHTKQARPYLDRLCAIVAVGRLKWIEGSKHDGKDNCCWYLFDKKNAGIAPRFYGRA